VNHRGRWNFALAELLFDAVPHESTLFGNEVRPEYCRHHNDAEGRPDTDRRANRVEQRNLDDGNNQKPEEEPGANAHTNNVVRPPMTANDQSYVEERVAYYVATMELRDLPSVNALADRIAESSDLPLAVVTSVCQESLDAVRKALIEGGDADPESIALARLADIEAARPTNVINATGVLLHTNLGRAPLNAAIAASTGRTAAAAGNVEMDVRTGRRSSRSDYLRALIPTVTGAEDGFAVNNNAGALLLALASVAGHGGSVAVSRGELIEIGGSFRLPDLMAASGATLVEVGTTNRTRLADYEVVAGSVDAILKVHPSNYRVEGFQEEASYADLSALASRNEIPFIADVGSGLLDESAPWLGTGDRSWLSSEPGVQQTVASGADLVLFSGDKLLGGPQAGILVGTTEAVINAAKHPIARAVRLDGPAIAAVSATLELYADQRVLEIPFWAMASLDTAEIEARAHAVMEGTSGPKIVDGRSLPGAGSVPGATLPTKLIELPGSADTAYLALAGHQPPIISSRRNDRAVLDLRSVIPGDDPHVAEAVKELLG